MGIDQGYYSLKEGQKIADGFAKDLRGYVSDALDELGGNFLTAQLPDRFHERLAAALIETGWVTDLPFPGEAEQEPADTEGEK